MTMANCHSSVKNPEAIEMGVHGRPLSSESGSQPIQYSVSNLVNSVRRLQKLCWHVVLLWKITAVLIRWEVPFVTLSGWILSLLICYFMESGQMLVSCISLLLLAGVGGLMNQNHQEQQRPTASKTLSHSNGSSSALTTTATTTSNAPPCGMDPSPAHDVEQQQKRGREVLAEYRHLMLQAQDWLNVCCEGVQRINAVLGWQDKKWSPVFYGISVLVLFMLYTLPLRWSIMAFISGILCINRDFVTLVKQLCDSVHHENSSDGNNNDAAEKKENDFNNILPEKETKQHVPSDAKPPIPQNTEHRPLHLCQKSKSLDEAGPNYAKVALAAANRNRSSTAPELPMLKLNSGTPVEVCHLCGTMFSSVLKRRRYCRSCGNQFCQRCCSESYPVQYSERHLQLPRPRRS